MRNHTVIVPVHNEATLLRSQITTFVKNVERNSPDTLQEILLIENGSSDGTFEACRQLQQENPLLVRAFQYSRPSYGGAVKCGIDQSRGTRLSILEVDFLDEKFLESSINIMDKSGVDIVIGSKCHPQSHDRRPFLRRALSAGINFLLRVFFGYKGTDTRGLKTMNTNVAKDLGTLAQTTDELFQTEIVLLAWRTGRTIAEIPIDIAETRPATGNLFRKSIDFVCRIPLLKKSVNRFPRPSNPRAD